MNPTNFSPLNAVRLDVARLFFLCCFFLVSVVQANPLLEAQVFFQKGTVFLRTDQYQKAIQAFSQAIALHANFAQAYHKRGTAHYYAKRSDLACLDWHKACQINVDCMGWNFGLYNKVCKKGGMEK